MVRLPVARQQQQRAGQPLFARVEELIDQVLFGPGVARQQVRDEVIGHRALLLEQTHHRAFANEEDHTRRNRRGAAHPGRLAGQALFAEEVSGAEHRHDGFPAGVRPYGQPDAAGLDIQDVLANLPLCEDRLSPPTFHDGLRRCGRIEKRLRGGRRT